MRGVCLRVVLITIMAVLSYVLAILQLLLVVLSSCPIIVGLTNKSDVSVDVLLIKTLLNIELIVPFR